MALRNITIKGDEILAKKCKPVKQITPRIAEACADMVETMLAADGVKAEVINIHTIKPIDEDIIINSAKKTGRVFTVEEHSVIGGLGGAVSEVLSEKQPTKVTRLGMYDRFGESGSAAALLEKYKLDGKGVYEQIKSAL